MQAISLFLKDRFSERQVEAVLSESFQLKPGRFGHGWVVVAPGGQELAVVDGTEDLPGMPPDMIGRASKALGGRFVRAKPQTRLTVMLMDSSDDVQWNAVLAIGRTFARRTKVVLDNHAGQQQTL